MTRKKINKNNKMDPDYKIIKIPVVDYEVIIYPEDCVSGDYSDEGYIKDIALVTLEGTSSSEFGSQVFPDVNDASKFRVVAGYDSNVEGDIKEIINNR